jgi:hypothetical protein
MVSSDQETNTLEIPLPFRSLYRQIKSYSYFIVIQFFKDFMVGASLYT